METSAKTAVGVEDAFFLMSEELIKLREQQIQNNEIQNRPGGVYFVNLLFL